MRVMVFAIATESTEQGEPPTMEAFEAMERFTEELVKAGVLVAGAGLKPSAESKRITIEGPSRTVIDGPFTEPRELIAGFSIWKVKDMDEAVAWAKRSPNIMPGPSKLELRPFFEAEDMADALELDAGTREKLGVA
ncbi:YciI family protein [Corallococcus carmarthensis]|uniref:YciI family protein n=1 Tax=Corallococcus carmarthensis TaxID=2316728 RepID=A0A3A8KPL3_9BACT|nr:YciI family protein [Corallococcus carmarthensis]RKH06211.1 YciI family protein [Corallococcus carmarthensis]